MQKETEISSLPQWDDSQSPFSVPDGYFDSLTARIMQNIPESAPEQKSARKVNLRPYFKWAAVSLATIGIGLGVYLAAPKDNRGGAERHTAAQMKIQQTPANDNLEQMADYMMLDQEDFYAYLSTDY